MEANISRIEEIVGDDKEMKKNLLHMFIDTCNRSLIVFESSIALDDTSSNLIWKTQAHELKGAAMNLGFEDLGIYCKQIEKRNFSKEEKFEAIKIIKDAISSVNDILAKL